MSGQTILTSLAEHGDDHLRGLLLHLLLSPSPSLRPSGQSSDTDTASSGSTSDDAKATTATNMSPKCFVAPHSLHAKLLKLMTSLETYSKRYASELLFALCDKNGQ